MVHGLLTRSERVYTMTMEESAAVVVTAGEETRSTRRGRGGEVFGLR